MKKPAEVDSAALVALYRGLPLLTFLKVCAGITADKARGEPFKKAPPPRDRREQYSRVQAGGAILLYRALQRAAPERALELTRTVMHQSGAKFMRANLGVLSRDKIAGMKDDERQSFVQKLAAKFFNANLEFTQVSEEGVTFEVSACDFPRLCSLADAPELAPLFCDVDAHYFAHVEPGVVLERPTTLANGDTQCLFSLRFREASESGETRRSPLVTIKKKSKER